MLLMARIAAQLGDWSTLLPPAGVLTDCDSLWRQVGSCGDFLDVLVSEDTMGCGLGIRLVLFIQGAACYFIGIPSVLCIRGTASCFNGRPMVLFIQGPEYLALCCDWSLEHWALHLRSPIVRLHCRVLVVLGGSTWS